MSGAAPSSVFILGGGAVSAAGLGLDATAATLAGDDVAPGSYTIPRSDGALVRAYYRPSLDEAAPAARLDRLLRAAVDEALAEAALGAEARREMALLVGTSSLDIAVCEAAYRERLAAGDDYVPLESAYGTLAATIAARLGCRGPQFVFNTACASTANALIAAARLIAAGEVRHALVVGVELANLLTASGFESLLLLADAVRPFDRDRAGIVLGEGCGALVLGGKPPTDRRRVRLRGSHTTIDRAGLTVSTPEGLAHAMAGALADAGVAPADVTAIKAQGAGSPGSDAAEAAALHTVFGTALPPLLSLKPWFGHLLGASGAVETATLLRCLERGFLPRTPGFAAVDGTLALTPTRAALPLAAGTFLLNYFGFGGANSCLVLEVE